MRFLSMFSGIDAASVAWGPLGWKAAAFCEIEAFPSAVLAHHYPDTPNLGDVTKADFDAIGPIDLAVFGSPCQSFSVAGLRLGLDDARGNLALIAGRIVYRKRPRWFVFENVPGLLSSDGGSDFGTLLAAFAGYPSGSVFQPPADGWGNAGVVVQANGDSYGLAWRVLDAQYFGVAQRRRRVFVVGYLGDWRRAAAVLFERHSLSGHPAPRREAGQRVAALTSSGVGTCGADDNQGQAGHLIPSTGETAHCLNAGGMGRQDYETETLIAHTLKGEGFDASEDGTGRGTPIVPVCFSAKDHGADAMSDLAPTLRAGGHSKSHANAGVMPAVAFMENQRGELRLSHQSDALTRGAKTPSPDAEGRVRLRDPGLGVGAEGDPADTLQAAGPGAVALLRTAETMYGVSHANAPQTGPVKALRALLEAAGEEAAAQWGLGVLAAFWPAEVLRPEVHGRGVRCSAIPQRGLVNVALSRSQAGSTWTVQDLWEAGRDGRAPQGWRPHEQRASELGAYLSELPYSPSPAQRLLHDMWGASEGAGLLREALSALQEARRSACGEVQSAHPGSAVRRLTIEECEALQGFPRSYTLIPYRKGMAADGPRYKSLGNSMAVPVMAWIGRRIAAVDALLIQSESTAA